MNPKNLPKLNDALFNDESINLDQEKMKKIYGGSSSDPTYIAANITATHLVSSSWDDTDND